MKAALNAKVDWISWKTIIIAVIAGIISTFVSWGISSFANCHVIFGIGNGCWNSADQYTWPFDFGIPGDPDFYRVSLISNFAFWIFAWLIVMVIVRAIRQKKP